MLLLDTYNILHTRGILPPRLAGIEIPGLIHLISLSRYAGQPLRLVCDGRRPPTDKASALRSGEERVTIGHAEVWYAGAGRDADALIERILRSGTGAASRRYLVISSDHRLQRAARQARAQYIPSPDFLRHLVHDESRPRHTPLPEFATNIPLDTYSIAHWVNEFQVGIGDWLALKSSPDQPAHPPPSPTGEVPSPLRGRGGGGSASENLQSPIPHPSADLRHRAGKPSTPNPTPAAPRPPAPSSPAPSPEPWVREALNLWGDRLRLDDLDMRKWLDP